MKALDLEHVKSAANFVCGLGGTDVTPATLRWTLSQTRVIGRQAARLAPINVPAEV